MRQITNIKVIFTKKPKLRKAAFFIWLSVVIILLSLYFSHQDWFEINQLRGLVEDHKWWVALIYVGILSVLGLFFIPSTPFAIGGAVLFSPTEAYLLNLIGILTSSSIVYYFAQFLKLDEALEARYPKKIKKIKRALENRELPIIIGWSAIPIVPTDLIIYVSSTLKIKPWKALIGVLIGEGTLNAAYIFTLDKIAL